MTAKPITKDSVICIHDAPQHADDIFCVASIQLMYPDITIIRSRKKEDWDKADFLIDVGNEYIPEEGRFDHHQESFTKYHKSPNTFNWERGPKYAAFGLIWEHYGKEIILAVLSFRRLKEQYGKNYNGGILLIDELDATLYGFSQNIERAKPTCAMFATFDFYRHDFSPI